MAVLARPRLFKRTPIEIPTRNVPGELIEDYSIPRHQDDILPGPVEVGVDEDDRRAYDPDLLDALKGILKAGEDLAYPDDAAFHLKYTPSVHFARRHRWLLEKALHFVLQNPN